MAGHYVAYVKDETSTWEKYDDEAASRVSPKEVARAQPYVAFCTATGPLGSGRCDAPTAGAGAAAKQKETSGKNEQGDAHGGEKEKGRRPGQGNFLNATRITFKEHPSYTLDDARAHLSVARDPETEEGKRREQMLLKAHKEYAGRKSERTEALLKRAAKLKNKNPYTLTQMYIRINPRPQDQEIYKFLWSTTQKPLRNEY